MLSAAQSALISRHISPLPLFCCKVGREALETRATPAPKDGPAGAPFVRLEMPHPPLYPLTSRHVNPSRHAPDDGPGAGDNGDGDAAGGKGKEYLIGFG